MTTIGLLVLFVWAAPATAGSMAAFQAVPNRVVDGDTVKFAEGNCRLAGIDAPESAQPLGDEATLRLRAMVDGRSVVVLVLGTDRFQRLLCVLLSQQGEIVNIALVRLGLAEVYRDFPRPFAPAFDRAERAAKDSGRGIWGLRSYERPQDFRRRMRQK